MAAGGLGRLRAAGGAARYVRAGMGWHGMAWAGLPRSARLVRLAAFDKSFVSSAERWEAALHSLLAGGAALPPGGAGDA